MKQLNTSELQQVSGGEIGILGGIAIGVGAAVLGPVAQDLWDEYLGTQKVLRKTSRFKGLKRK